MNGFEKIISVDWSAANRPVHGGDSVWVACITESGVACRNPKTRTLAVELLLQHIRSAGGRVLLGFDFSFAYPQGFVTALGLQHWWQIWHLFHTGLTDDAANRNNRFEFAGRLNQRLNQRLDTGEGPFWGHPAGQTFAHLKPTKPETFPFEELRRTEVNVRGAQSAWKLAYAGSVGSQTLTGLARLWSLRAVLCKERKVTVWPFEELTGVDTEVVIVELYHSLFGFDRTDPVRDRAQVITSAKELAAAPLDRWFSIPGHYGEAKEEGWTLGVLG